MYNKIVSRLTIALVIVVVIIIPVAIGGGA